MDDDEAPFEPTPSSPDFLAMIREEQAARRAGKDVIETMPVFRANASTPVTNTERASARVITLADSRRVSRHPATTGLHPRKVPQKEPPKEPSV